MENGYSVPLFIQPPQRSFQKMKEFLFGFFVDRDEEKAEIHNSSTSQTLTSSVDPWSSQTVIYFSVYTSYTPPLRDWIGSGGSRRGTLYQVKGLTSLGKTNPKDSLRWTYIGLIMGSDSLSGDGRDRSGVNLRVCVGICRPGYPTKSGRPSLDGDKGPGFQGSQMEGTGTHTRPPPLPPTGRDRRRDRTTFQWSVTKRVRTLYYCRTSLSTLGLLFPFHTSTLNPR